MEIPDGYYRIKIAQFSLVISQMNPIQELLVSAGPLCDLSVLLCESKILGNLCEFWRVRFFRFDIQIF